MTDPADKLFPHKPNVATVSIPVVQATTDSFADYGKIIDSVEPQPVSQEPWRDDRSGAWRERDPGTGINTSVIEGKFVIEYAPDYRSLIGFNAGVSSKGDPAAYTIGWLPDPNNPTKLLVDQFNRHGCSDQHFILNLDQDCILLLGRTPPGVHSDNITPEDCIAFLCTKGKTYVIRRDKTYHQPPLLLVNESQHLALFTRQGSIHDCRTAFFKKEFGICLELNLERPSGAPITLAQHCQRLIRNYATIALQSWSTPGMPIPASQRSMREAAMNYLRGNTLANVNFDDVSSLQPPKLLSALELQSLVEAFNPKEDQLGRILKIIFSRRLSFLNATARYLVDSEQNCFLHASDYFPLTQFLHQTFNDKHIGAVPPQLTQAAQTSAGLIKPHLTPHAQCHAQMRSLKLHRPELYHTPRISPYANHQARFFTTACRRLARPKQRPSTHRRLPSLLRMIR